ncbi:MAG: hypothetical protein ACXVB9_02455 [Bdellovibrionota bacterium]
MKKSLLLLALLLAPAAHAEPRAFRITQGTQSGFGLAWGVKNTPVDFELVERTDADAFLQKYDGQFQNYLVDLKTNRVLALLSGADSPNEEVSFSFGDLHMGNHFGLSISDLGSDSELLGSGDEVALVSEDVSYKWSNELENIFAIQTAKDGEAGFEATIVAQCENCPAQVDGMLKSKMSAADAKLFDSLYGRVVEYKLERDSQDKPLLTYSVSADGGKSDIPDTMAIRAQFGITLKSGKVILSLQKYSAKKGKVKQ